MLLVCTKGGARILTYEMTVVLVSIPFVSFVAWRAPAFGLSRNKAFLMATFLCLLEMIFPWVLRTSWTIWWILSIMIIIAIGLLYPAIIQMKRNNKVVIPEMNLIIESKVDDEVIPKILRDSICKALPETFDVLESEAHEEKSDVFDNEALQEKFDALEDIALQENFVALENEALPEKLDEVENEAPPETFDELEDKTPYEENPNPVDESVSIEDLIELGFQEKNLSNSELAAHYFSRALDREPAPDLALYLIMDCYWLWNDLGERDHTLTQIQAYISKYLPQFNPTQRHQFDAWMTKEKIYQHREII